MDNYIEIEGIDASSYAGKAALAVRKKARGIIGDEFITYNLLDFVNIMHLNNKFASLGIYITDDNREEAYIKIIEMNQPDLIDDLEKFINLKDSIQLIDDKRTEYYNIISQLQEVDKNDVEQVNDIIKDYLKR